jgi:hypothetical protein
MTRNLLLFAGFLSVFISPALAAPSMSVIPQGIQSGNWVWQVDISPDLVLAGGPTPVALELGFRLTGDPLVSVTNLNPAIFSANNPGNVIFGWEVLYAHANNHPVGIEVNCASCTVTNTAPLGSPATTIVPGTTNEIFSAMGSTFIAGPIPFLKIVAKGPGTGGPLSSTIEWLGAYNGKGRIAQLTGPTSSANFDLYAGTATQMIPEPTSGALLAFGAILVLMRLGRAPK